MRRALIALAALAIAGCGGSSSTNTVEQTTSGPALSKAEFIKRADAICGEYRRRRAALNKELGSEFQARHFDAAAKALGQEIDAGRKEVEKLRALAAPQADTAVLGTLFDKLDEGFSAVEDAQASLAAGDVPGYLSAGGQAAEPDREAKSIAADYGFKVCGQG